MTDTRSNNCCRYAKNPENKVKPEFSDIVTRAHGKNAKEPKNKVKLEFSDTVTRAHGTDSRRGQGRGKIVLSFFYSMPSIATNVTARQKKA